MVSIGLEVLAREPRRFVPAGARTGLLLNAASVDRGFQFGRDVVACALGRDLVSLFGPQHGLWCDVQDNMIESPHGVDARLRLPVWSLYAEDRKPRPEMLRGLDVLLVDLQDVGARVYTFAWTLRLAMLACAEAGVKVVVLDRPNPLGGETVEGSLLRRGCESFVGPEPVPMRHGLTLGELALWLKGERGIDCELEVVPLEGWRREMLWPQTGRPWVMPSPNMPAFETAVVYPGTVLLEGTTASEGRGTTRPFEMVGGPWCDGEALALQLAGLPGLICRPVVFQPTFQKWAGRSCGGVFLHVTDPTRFRSFRTGVALLAALWRLWAPQGFGWRPPPYEYEHERLPIHLLLGDEDLRRAIEEGADAEDLEQSWEPDLASWREQRAPFLLYG